MVFYSTPFFLFYILATMSLDDSEQQYIYSEIYLELSTIFTQLS